MKIVEPSVRIIDDLNREKIYKKIELCGRTCYKSEEKITEDSAEKFIRGIIRRGHESVLEHVNVTVKFVTDRGISHEIVRHRVASYSQESTRYCNYSGEKFGHEISFVMPKGIKGNDDTFVSWKSVCATSEAMYFYLLECGVKSETARSVLPTCLKTELVMTANLREWRHFMRLRTSKAAHPDIRNLAEDLLMQFKEKIPVFFEDIEVIS